MVKLERCPVCQVAVHEIEEKEFGCENCGRVWVYTQDEMWVSKVRKVRLKREPRVGDSPNDFLEPIKDE